MRSFKKNGNIVYNSQNGTASDNLILEQYLEQRQTLNSERNRDVLRNQLDSAIRRKRRGFVVFWRVAAVCQCPTSYSPSYRAAKSGFKLEVLPQTPYSSDLALSDFHLFWPLKDALRGRHFRSGEEVKEAAYDWLAQQPKEFYSRGFIP
jgi:histone-lysine N-methyltransferase SETMAR